MPPALATALPRLAVALAAMLVAATAAAVELPAAATATQAMVIPPGQEQLVTQMLTPDGSWPAGVALEGAEIEGDAVTARYVVAQTSAPLRVQLRHRGAAGMPDAATARFALKVLPGAHAWPTATRDAVVAALARQVTSLEASFKWTPASAAGVALPAAPAGLGDALRALGEATDAARNRDLTTATARARQAAELAQPLDVAARAWVLAGVAAVLRSAGDGEAQARAVTAVELAAEVTVADGRVALARAQFALDRHQQAADTLRKLVGDAALRKAACPLLETIADDLATTERSTLALTVLRDWQTADGSCIAAALAASRVARWAGVGAQALPLLERAHADHPKDVAVAIHLAHLYKEIGRFDEALRLVDGLDYRGAHLDKALVLDITRVYLDVQDNAASLAVQRQRSDADPTEPVSAFVVGTILHHTDHWAESNRYLARSQSAFSQEPRQFIYTGMNHYRLGNQAEAETRIERALQLGKSDPDIYYCRAVIRTRKAPDAALADLQTYLKMTAGSRETYAPKEAKVARMVEDLQACRDARDVPEGLDVQAGLRTARQWAPKGLALLALLGVAGLLVRKRRRAALAAAALALTAIATLAPALAVAVTPVSAADHGAVGDLRPTLRAPTALAAQWTWLSRLDRVQVTLAALLLVTSGGFFLPPRR